MFVLEVEYNGEHYMVADNPEPLLYQDYAAGLVFQGETYLNSDLEPLSRAEVVGIDSEAGIVFLRELETGFLFCIFAEPALV